MTALAAKAEALWKSQIETWPMLADGLDALLACEYRTVRIGGLRMELQWNPGRIISVTAKVDPQSIAARPCFLCPHNLPPEQEGIAFQNDWQVLCNPRPILVPHFTLPLREHLPQDLDFALETMLAFAENLGETFVVFYNGPQCGASAPDHMHFQAVPAAQTPLLQQLNLPGTPPTEGVIDWNQSSNAEPHRGFAREPFLPLALWLGTSLTHLSAELRHALTELRQIHSPGDGNEALVNAFAWAVGDACLFGIFPRAKHRPACYGTGQAQVLLSPGTLDLLGRIVTPRQIDYQGLRDSEVEAILQEVCLPRSLFQTWQQAILA